MNKNEKFVITINRELGSGGRTVGEKLAAKLGVPFYDKALIKALTKKYNLTVEEIEKLKGRSHSWWADFMRVVSVGQGIIDVAIPSYASIHESYPQTTGEMFRAEKEILEEIAEEESCIIAGRTAFFIMKDHPNRLSILIHAPMENRIARLMRKQGMSREEAEKTSRR